MPLHEMSIQKAEGLRRSFCGASAPSVPSYRLVTAETGSALVRAAMHSSSTAIHNGARPNALNMANAVETNKSRNGRYTNSMGPVFLVCVNWRGVPGKSIDPVRHHAQARRFTLTADDEKPLSR